MNVKIFCLILLGACRANASPAPPCSSDRCLSAVTKADLDRLMDAVRGNGTDPVIRLCRQWQGELLAAGECVEESVDDQCTGKAGLLQRIDAAHRQCQAANRCYDDVVSCSQQMARGGRTGNNTACNIIRNHIRCVDSCMQMKAAFIRPLQVAFRRTLDIACGSSGHETDGETTTTIGPSFCDIKKAEQCAPRYTEKLQSSMEKVTPPSRLYPRNVYRFLRRLLEGVTDMVDFNALCRITARRDATIRPCLEDALGSCTDPQLRERHHTFLQFLDFCKLAQDCYFFSMASYKTRQCVRGEFNELVNHVRAGYGAINQSTICRYVKASAMCVYNSYDVCPRAQNYIRQKIFIGAGLHQMRSQCPGLSIRFPSRATGTHPGYGHFRPYWRQERV